MSRRVSGCREEGISGEPALGEVESEISPVTTQGKDAGLDEGSLIQIRQDPSHGRDESLLLPDQILHQSPSLS